MSGRRVLITGATGSVGRALARRLAARGDTLVLAGREPGEAEALARDCAARFGVRAEALEFDAELHDGAALVERACERVGVLTGVVVVHGVMIGRDESLEDPTLFARMCEVNLGSAGAVALAACARMAEGSFVCLVSSVAGDRGRASNFPYGATKAGLSAFGEGLAAWAWQRGIAVTVVRPGVIDSAMTWGLGEGGEPGRLEPGGMVADPGRIADDIVRGIDCKHRVVYTPGRWRLVMLVIRWLPWTLFKRVKF